MAYKPTAAQIIGKILRVTIYSFIAMLCGFLVWRIYFSTIPPKELDKLTVNETLAAAYEVYGDELVFFRQNQASITRNEAAYGYFTVIDCIIIPEAGQVQVLFRYNKRMARHVLEDFRLDSLPDINSELFDLSLVKTVDLTPDDSSDNNDRDFIEEVRYTPSSVAAASTMLYQYRRIVFDNVSIDDAIGLFFDVYYIERADYDRPPYGVLCLYDYISERIPAQLTSAEKKALKRAVEQPAS